jgi:hypothetical protein
MDSSAHDDDAAVNERMVVGSQEDPLRMDIGVTSYQNGDTDPAKTDSNTYTNYAGDGESEAVSGDVVDYASDVDYSEDAQQAPETPQQKRHRIYHAGDDNCERCCRYFFCCYMYGERKCCCHFPMTHRQAEKWVCLNV